MKELFIIDRREGDYYLLENEYGEVIEVKKELINSSVNDGDVLIKKRDGYYLDIEETNKRKKFIKNLVEGMWSEGE